MVYIYGKLKREHKRLKIYDVTPLRQLIEQRLLVWARKTSSSLWIQQITLLLLKITYATICIPTF